MEAASIPGKPARGTSPVVAALRTFFSRYGLIIALLALPVAFAIHDIRVDHSLTHIAENLKDGISNGAIWALIAIGYTLVYGIIELINFAHGDVFMIGSFVSFGIWSTLGVRLATWVSGSWAGWSSPGLSRWWPAGC